MDRMAKTKNQKSKIKDQRSKIKDRKTKTDLRHRFVKEIVRVAVSPFFALFEGLDDRVLRRVVMFGRVFVRARIAAADVAADFAEAEMNPPVAGFETVLAAVGARRHLFDLREMLALLWHHVFFPSFLYYG
jgi:hypothetical protein